MLLNQVANVPIGASREHASVGYKEALEVWMLWHTLVS